jgi:lipoate-protein ligase A
MWRLLDVSLSDPKLNVAIDEALLIGRHCGFCGETLRLWTSEPSIFLPRTASINNVDMETCKKFNVSITRRVSPGDIIYSDSKTLNFSLILNEKNFRIPLNPLEAYDFMYSFVQRTLNRLGFDTSIKYAKPLLIDGKIVSMATQYYYYDNLLFHGAIFVDTDLSIVRKVMKSEPSETFTTLTCEIGREISVDDVKKLLSSSFEETFGINLAVGEISEKEKEVLDTLYRRKYVLDKWNIKGESPLTLKDALVEVYIAYPPTPLCRSLLSLINGVTANLRERLEIRIWHRGMGPPPGVDITPGLKHASKLSIIPAVIINGELKFGPEIPSKDALKGAIEKALEYT